MNITHGTRVSAIALLGAALAAITLTVAVEAQPKPITNPAKIGGKPNMNGVRQAISTANWNLEDHSASALKDF